MRINVIVVPTLYQARKNDECFVVSLLKKLLKIIVDHLMLNNDK